MRKRRKFRRVGLVGGEALEFDAWGVVTPSLAPSLERVRKNNMPVLGVERDATREDARARRASSSKGDEVLGTL